VALNRAGTVLAANTLNEPHYTKGSVVLWNTVTGKLTATLIDPHGRGGGAPVVFGPDGSTLATGDADGSIYLWNTKTDALIRTFRDPSNQPDYGFAFSPRTGFLAAANGNGTTYLWNTSQARVTATFRDPHTQGVHGVAFSPDGSILAAGDDNGDVYLWKAATDTLIATLTGIQGGTVHSVAFSPRKGILAATINDSNDSKCAIYVWDTGGKLLATFHNPGSEDGTMLAFSPDGKTLAVGDENANTYVWNVNALG
jgi:WD40 repeat protein